MAKRPRPASDIKDLPVTDESIEHLQGPEVTDQDLPDIRTPDQKTFMGQVVPGVQKFDDETAVKFLAYYSTTGRKNASARAVGVQPNTVQRWERNNQEFAELVQDAKRTWLESLEREAFRRGVEGVLEPVVGGKDPKIVTYVRKYSDKLLEMMLRKADPTGYAGKGAEISVNVKTGVLVAPAATDATNTPLKIESAEDEEPNK